MKSGLPLLSDRRDLSDKGRKTGITQGQVIETRVTIGASIVVGAAISPKAPPQTLRSIGALPEETLGVTQTTKPAPNLINTTEPESVTPTQHSYCGKSAKVTAPLLTRAPSAVTTKNLSTPTICLR